MRRFLLSVAALAASALPAFSQGTEPGPAADDATILQRAETAYDRGIAGLNTDSTGAKASFAESAAAYGELADQRGIRNPRLLANLGNAYLLAGDTGRAVLSYRRAARIDPTDQTVRAGLSLVRSRVGTVIEPGSSDRMGAWLAGWRNLVAPSSLLVIGAFAWAAGWLALALDRVRPGPRRRSGVAAAVIVLGAIGIGVVIADEEVGRHSADAVLLSDSTIGRKGPGGAAYEASFDKPLGAGVEMTVLEGRGEWLRVRLADGRETWVPRSAIERL